MGSPDSMAFRLAAGGKGHPLRRKLEVSRQVAARIFGDESVQRARDAFVAARHTVVFGLDGEVVGHPEMIALLETEPLEPETAGSGYAGGVFDRAAQACGWFGLLGWVLFSRPRASRLPAAGPRES